jgi:hypothetical protein
MKLRMFEAFWYIGLFNDLLYSPTTAGYEDPEWYAEKDMERIIWSMH